MLGAIVSADKKLSETAFVIVRKLLRKHKTTTVPQATLLMINNVVTVSLLNNATSDRASQACDKRQR